MIAYLDGDRTCVFQWDNKRRLILDGFPAGCVVAYSNECAKPAPVVESYSENGILYANIPAGQSKQITYTIRLNYPTA